MLDGVSSDILTPSTASSCWQRAAFVIGWHTKAANVVLLVGFIASPANAAVHASPRPPAADHAAWRCPTWLSHVWSVDAALTPDSEQAVADWLRTGLHNVGLIGLGTQVALAYLAGGLEMLRSRPGRTGRRCTRPCSCRSTARSPGG